MTLDMLHADAARGPAAAGRRRHLGRHREHPHRGPRLPRAGRRRSAASPAADDPPRDRAPRVRQGRATSSASRSSTRPIDPETTLVDVDFVRDAIDDRTARDRRLGLQLRLRHDRPDRASSPSSRSSAASACTSTAASAASSCPGARSSATTSRSSTSACPASPRSRPTPTSTATRSRARRCSPAATSRSATRQYFIRPDWTGGKYLSPGIDGSRSGGLLAATWAAMVSIGREGYLEYAQLIFETAFAMQDAVRSHPELRIMGKPDVLLQLHVRRVRHLPRERLHAAARLALQRPAVPERDPHVRHPAADPAGRGRGVRAPTSPRRVAYAKGPHDAAPKTGAVYGSMPKNVPTDR